MIDRQFITPLKNPIVSIDGDLGPTKVSPFHGSVVRRNMANQSPEEK